MSTTTLQPHEDTATVRSTRQPAYVVRTTAAGWEVEAKTPGVTKDGFKLSIHDRVLTVEAHPTATVSEAWRPLHRESDSRDFRLDLQLPSRVNRDGVKARLRDGVLTIGLPRAEAYQPRTIEVEA
ncbi:MAG: Hsp20/alpha crystallin family protein [Verrucomicrobiota bacterium]